MARNTIKNVTELARTLGEDKTFHDDLAGYLRGRSLIHKLTALRAARGLTQQDVAARMECSQGRISKMETADDRSLNFGALVEYAQALGLRLEITITDQNATAVDRVKHHAFCIKRLTDDLARLALADESIAEGVGKFFNEAAFNLLRMLQSSAKTLPAVSNGPIAVDTCGVDDPEDAREEAGRSAPAPRSTR